MKKLIIAGLTLILFQFVSCNAFLEEKPQSEIASSAFFASADDAYIAVNQLYRKGVPGFYGAGVYNGSTISAGGYLSGMFYNDNSGSEQFINSCQNLILDPVTNNNNLVTMWRDTYEVIVRNANFALENLPTCPGLTDAQRKQLIAETKFFRAINYFYLVKMFGAVPIVTNSYKTLDNMLVRKASVKKVYEFIVADLEDALKGGLAEKPMPENKFRVSQASVAALLADVYLNMAGAPLLDASKYAEAARVAKTYLLDPKYASVYSLIQNVNLTDKSAYNILRTSDLEKEYLYTIEYDLVISTTGSRPQWCLPIAAASWGEFKYTITNPAYTPSETLLAAYDPINDLRFQERQYFHTQYTRTKGPDAGKVELIGRLPFFWYDEVALLSTAISGKDQVHYRLTEVYLIAAEAIAMSQSVAEAAKYLAPIKARASLNKTQAQIETELSALSQADFVKEVWAEKVRELVFENKIWNDITRTRMYPNVVAGKFTFVPVVGAKNDFGKTFAEKDLLFPIPNDETQRNPSLALEPEN